MAKYKLGLLLLVLGLLVYFPLCLHLTNYPIRIWDEARLAHSAYDMARGGNVFVTTYKGEMDMWNTKPPLMIWLQAICIKIFGAGELAVRLPSVLAAFLTCCVLFFFSYRFMKSKNLGVAAILVLITSFGYATEHVIRTGDYDALLTLFSTLALLCFFVSTETEGRRSSKYLLLFFVALTLGVLCKGIAILMFLPAILLYGFFSGKTKRILTDKTFYIGLAVFVFFAAGWYLLRESLSPGYLKSVWENELGGRYFAVNEGHVGTPWDYYLMLLNEQFNFWYLLVPCGLLLGLFQRDKRVRNLALFLSLCIFQFLLAISMSKTMLSWYTAPLFPLLALLSAIFLSWVMDMLQNSDWLKASVKTQVLPVIFIFIVFAKPYSEVVTKFYSNKEFPWAEFLYKIPNYLKLAVEGHKNLDGYYIVDDEYPSSIDFYNRILAEKGQKLTLILAADLKPGNKVIAAHNYLKEEIERKYNVEVIEDKDPVRVYKIISVK